MKTYTENEVREWAYSIVSKTALGYRTEEEHEKLESFADRICKSIATQPISVEQRFPPVLDSCCSNRAFWFNKKDPRAIYVDKRKESIVLTDRVMEISPDIQADFTNLPFPDNTFTMDIEELPYKCPNTLDMFDERK